MYFSRKMVLSYTYVVLYVEKLGMIFYYFACSRDYVRYERAIQITRSDRCNSQSAMHILHKMH